MDDCHYRAGRDHPPPRLASFPAPDFTCPRCQGRDPPLGSARPKWSSSTSGSPGAGRVGRKMPTLDALYQQYKDRGLEVLAVNLDTAPIAKIQAFVGEAGASLRVGLDPSSSTARTYRVLGLPTTYLIDRAGNVVVREVGGRDWLDGVSQRAVESLLPITRGHRTRLSGPMTEEGGHVSEPERS